MAKGAPDAKLGISSARCSLQICIRARGAVKFFNRRINRKAKDCLTASADPFKQKIARKLKGLPKGGWNLSIAISCLLSPLLITILIGLVLFLIENRIVSRRSR